MCEFSMFYCRCYYYLYFICNNFLSIYAFDKKKLNYFNYFVYLVMFGVFLSTALFAYLGMNLTTVGSRLQTTSHKEAIYKICGRYVGFIVDAIIVFTLFGVGVVMIAGAGSIVKQQFNMQPFEVRLIKVIIVILTMMLNVDKVVGVIGSITPFLLVMIVIISIYSVFTMDLSFYSLNPIAKSQESTLPNWFI